MEEHAQQSSDTTYVVIPKKEIDEELEITFEKECQDNQLIVPKVEFGDELSDNFDDLDDINLSNPMKRERMLSEEFIIPKEEIITDQLLDDYDSEHHEDSLIKPIKVELMLSEEIVNIRQKDSEVEKKTDLTQTSKSSDKRQSSKRTRRSAAERLAQEKPDTSESFSGHQQSSSRKKTAAQRHREYRERKKLILASEPSSDNQKSKRQMKTEAQRHREYRERRKLRLASAQANSNKSGKVKTEAQRHKEYRERRKRLAAESIDSQLSVNIPTSTSRVVKFRERALIKKLSTIVNAHAVTRKKDLTEENESTNQPDQKLAYVTKMRTRRMARIQNDAAKNQNGANRLNKASTQSDVTMEVDVVNADGDYTSPGTNGKVYRQYSKHARAHIHFFNLFTNNTFGHSCVVCDRLWWERDLKDTCEAHQDTLNIILPNYVTGTTVRVCATCKVALDKQKIPALSTYNGFRYPEIPPHLPKLDTISKRLISPRIPFTQIRRLRHVQGQSAVNLQIINVPVEVDTLVNRIPRSFDDDHCFYVNIKKKLIHKTSYVDRLINKKHIEEWLAHLIPTPVYVHHNITVDEDFFNNYDVPELNIEEVSEPEEDNIKAQQQTLIWNEDMFLNVASGDKVLQVSKLFDGNTEEMSFPTIYGGQFRSYREGVHASPFMQATSELRRTDRRGVDPEHLLYMAVKIMRQRIKDSVAIAFKHVGAAKDYMKSEGYIEHCIETNLAFLRCIPNSAWYWSDRKKDLFSVIRQNGAPTAYISLSANETGWDDLLKLLYKLRNSGAKISDKAFAKLSYAQKTELVNEDAVTCAIYFSKMVNCLIQVLQCKKKCPFGKYRVLHYFKRIEFQHQGSPIAHILLWLENAPACFSNVEVSKMVEELVSVSASEASGNIKHQTHRHTFRCYKKTDIGERVCRFGAPFLPVRKTIILSPMKDSDNEEASEKYRERYRQLLDNLESVDYTDFGHYYAHNNIESDEQYYDIIRAGINSTQLFYKRKPSEKWHETFNPFVLHHTNSNMSIQIIHDDYSCAAFVAKCARRSNRGISDLQCRILEAMEHPEFDITEITRHISVDIFNSIEISAQEAAWYLLREPMAKSSIATVYIPTVHPAERQRIRKTLSALNAMDDDYSDICKENWFDKYEKRPAYLGKVTFAQFVAKYCKNNKGEYIERKEAKVIRYRNYEMVEHFNDYRREMVLLHIPFRSEDKDILADNKFVQLFEDNKDVISERRKDFESSPDIHNTLELCGKMCRDETENEEEPLRSDDQAPFEAFSYQQLLSELRPDDNASHEKLCAKLRENPIDTEQFHQLMRSANQEQKELLMHLMYHLQTLDRSPFQFF